MKYVPVQAVSVFLWGKRVGVLAYAYDQYSRFEYDPDFRRSELEIAPIVMPLSRAMYVADEFELPRRSQFFGLPGVFADSLPDSFGQRLIGKWMEARGIDVSSVTPLDRLSYVGSRGMGALTYEPEARADRLPVSALDMRRLVEESRLALNADLSKMDADDALREIIRVGTSAGGAQAKAVVGWRRTDGSFLAGDAGLPADYEHWIVKFSPKDDSNAGQREYDMYLKAKAAGVEMSECRLFELDGVRHFMTRRFDRDGERRFHVQTLAALQHLPPGGPRSLYSYDVLFDTAEALGLGYEAREQLFRRMAFNVCSNEIDDHTKNFSFMMKEDGVWRLAPAYDLTGFHFSDGDAAYDRWQNQHALSVNGKFSGITDEDMLAVGEKYAIGTAPKVLAEVHQVFV